MDAGRRKPLYYSDQILQVINITTQSLRGGRLVGPSPGATAGIVFMYFY